MGKRDESRQELKSRRTTNGWATSMERMMMIGSVMSSVVFAAFQLAEATEQKREEGIRRRNVRKMWLREC